MCDKVPRPGLHRPSKAQQITEKKRGGRFNQPHCLSTADAGVCMDEGRDGCVGGGAGGEG